MAWKDVAIPMLRVLINDMDDTPKYSDNRLEQILLTSAVLLVQDIEFPTNYSVNFIVGTITPDPVDDIDFMSFLIVKSACQTDFSTYRCQALLDGVSAKMGPASLTVNGNLVGFKTLIDIGPCATYDGMKKDYVFGGATLCRAVLSPFIGNNFDPANLGFAQTYFIDRR